MEEELEKNMREDIRKMLVGSIEDAKKGELSPHWQEYVRREIQAAQEGGYLPEETDALLNQLDAVLADIPQISDAELSRRQLAASGTELVYHDSSEDYGTLVEITFMPDKKQYAACVFLDVDAAQDDMHAYALGIEQAVWEWVQSEKIDLVDSDIPPSVPEDQPERFGDLKTALQYVLSALRHPETLI